MATVLDEPGLPSGDVADQLGNTRAVTEKHYIARRVANEQAAAALAGIVAPTTQICTISALLILSERSEGASQVI